MLSGDHCGCRIQWWGSDLQPSTRSWRYVALPVRSGNKNFVPSQSSAGRPGAGRMPRRPIFTLYDSMREGIRRLGYGTYRLRPSSICAGRESKNSRHGAVVVVQQSAQALAPLDHACVSVMANLRADDSIRQPARKDLDLVFCNHKGDYCKPDRISSRVAEITAKAGLRGMSLHSLRHGHASQLLSEGVPIPTVSKRLGHANPAITLKLYSHALEPDELAAAQCWDNAFADVVLVQADATAQTTEG